MTTTGVVDAGTEIRCMGCNKSGWCPHISEYVSSGEDASMLHAEMHVFVPLFPTYDLHTVVSISDEKYPGAALMEIDHTPDFGNPRRIALGFWNIGEGRLSMRRVITDWLKSQFPNGRADLRCPSSTHNFKQVNELTIMLLDNEAAVWPNAWSTKMEGACIPCIRLSANPDDVPDPDNTPPWRQ